MKTLIFFLAQYGAALSLTVLAIGEPVRSLVERIFAPKRAPYTSDEEWGKRELTKSEILVHCPACIGFWITVAGSLLIYSPTLDSGVHCGRIPAALIDGLAAVALNWVMHVVLTRLGQYDQ